MTEYAHHPPVPRNTVPPVPGTDKIEVVVVEPVTSWDDAYTLAQCLTVALDMTRQRGV